jgi:hypothetical protein
MAEGDVTMPPRRAAWASGRWAAVEAAREREAANVALAGRREESPDVAAASAGSVGRVDGRRLVLVAWALLMILALGVGWVSARGSFGLRVLVCLGLGATGLYLYLRLRDRR